MKLILYIVVPCYNEEDCLADTNNKLLNLLKSMIQEGSVSADSRVLYVNDGSNDSTWNIILDFHQKDILVSGVKLAGNCGHQNALMAGLSVAKDDADIMISIDADLQDDISVIPQMVRLYQEGSDIVYGVRKSRSSDTFFKRTTALTFYKLMNSLGVRSVYNHADYRLMSKRAVNQLCLFRERNLFLRGIVPLVGYQTACVYYDRSERMAGESKYPFSKMLNFAIDGITSFSTKPVRMVLLMGISMVLLSFLMLFYVIYSYFHHHVVAGWSSIILSIWFVGGMVLMGLGIVGEYIGKIYIEVKDRPRYNIETIIKRKG